MASKLCALLAGLGLWACWPTDARAWAWIPVVLAVWGLGIASNFRHDPMSMPNYAVYLSLLGGLAGIGTIIVGLVSR